MGWIDDPLKKGLLYLTEALGTKVGLHQGQTLETPLPSGQDFRRSWAIECQLRVISSGLRYIY